MQKKIFGIAGGIALTIGGSAALGSILPPNNLHLEDHLFKNADMTEARFNEIIDEIVTEYEADVEALGGKLDVSRLWDDSTVNASANRVGSTWAVNMYGGLARRPEVTDDGFALVVCHELGHHLAGFPFKGFFSWASNEGQSDYFATQSCARRVWADDLDLNASYAQTVDEAARNACDESWAGEEDRNLCYRVAMAGKSLGQLLAALKDQGVPEFTTPDLKVAPRTNHNHPDGQCRLDTYFAGALCDVSFPEALVPGLEFGFRRNSQAAEESAGQYACINKELISARPACWFKARI